MPGSVKSAPKLARPVTLSIPSGRTGRVPTHLNSDTGPLSLIAQAPRISAAAFCTARTILS